MKTLPFLSLIAMMLAFVPAASAQVTVGNIRPVQRMGTKLVDVDYDITGVATPVMVTLEISADGGVNWNIPVTSATGAIGPSVMPGNNLRIVWNAGVDWDKQRSAQVRFRLKANDHPPDLVNMALIPAGPFTMGDALDGDTKAPLHTVNVGAFYIGKYEVTAALWEDVRAWGAAHQYTDLPAASGTTASHPVQSISWNSIVKWCNAKSEKEGLAPCYYTDTAHMTVYRSGNTTLNRGMVLWAADGYRLPTEAEWEKAARGGASGMRFPWGGTSTISHTQANYTSNSSPSYDASPTTGHHPSYNTSDNSYTAPVGSFPPNGYGLYDVAGNVIEYCWDWYANTYPTTEQQDPLGPETGGTRVVRGGATNSNAINCRVADRTYDSVFPAQSYNYFGFRIACRVAP